MCFVLENSQYDKQYSLDYGYMEMGWVWLVYNMLWVGLGWVGFVLWWVGLGFKKLTHVWFIYQYSAEYCAHLYT